MSHNFFYFKGSLGKKNVDPTAPRLPPKPGNYIHFISVVQYFKSISKNTLLPKKNMPIINTAFSFKICNLFKIFVPFNKLI